MKANPTENHSNETLNHDEGDHSGKARRIGFLSQKISVPDDFDEMNASEIEELFTL